MNRLAEENAKQQALTLLRDSLPLKSFILRGEVRLLYGLYDMETGTVVFTDLAARDP